MFSVARLLSETRLHASEIFGVCERMVQAANVGDRVAELGPQFAQCPANSIDYAVMEKTSHGAVVPLAAGWSDVGSWSAVRCVAA
jgi:mannose-1-phosphate guanylyltransferase